MPERANCIRMRFCVFKTNCINFQYSNKRANERQIKKTHKLNPDACSGKMNCIRCSPWSTSCLQLATTRALALPLSLHMLSIAFSRSILNLLFIISIYFCSLSIFYVSAACFHLDTTEVKYAISILLFHKISDAHGCVLLSSNRWHQWIMRDSKAVWENQVAKDTKKNATRTKKQTKKRVGWIGRTLY